MKKQDDIFSQYEGDNWFLRNKDFFKTRRDLSLFLINLYNLKPKLALEIGASNGYRLAQIYKKYKAKVYAIEPSTKAIRDGQEKWPFIKFQKSTSALMNYNEHSFDLVIVNSVFHWIHRDELMKSIAKIDNVLKWEGHLIIGDFQIHCPMKRRYHHIKNETIFTYKVDYKKIFLSTGFYKEIATVSIDHDTKILTTKTSIRNYFSLSLLKKEDLYIKMQ